MRKITTLIILLLLVSSNAQAGVLDWFSNLFTPSPQSIKLGATVSQSIQGGTGTSTPPTNNSILLGNADKTYNVKTLTAGTNITFTETGNSLTITGSAGGSGDPFPFDPIYSGTINATSTTLGFLNGFISSGASSSISDLVKFTNTGTTTFTGGIYTDALQTNLVSCDSLDTNASGAIICGVDATGGGSGVPNLIYRTLGTTKFYTASSSATDNNVWHFNNGFIGSASSSIAGDLRIDGSLLGTATFALTGSGTSTLTNGLSVGGGGLLTSKGLSITGGALKNTGTATSTFTGGIFANDLKINFPSCSNGNKLITDASGSITCAAEALDGAYTGTYDGNNFGGGAIGTGDLLYGSAAGTISELAAGTRGTILSLSTGGIPLWISTSTFAHLNANQTFTGSNSFSGVINASSTVHGSGSVVLGLSTAPQMFFLDDNSYTRWGVRNAGGNLYFATTTVGSNATSSPFAFQLTGTGGTGLFVGTTTNNNATGLAVKGTIFFDTDTSGAAFTYTACGNAGFKFFWDTTTCVLSAERYKKDIKPISIGLAELLKARPVWYHLKDPVNDINAKAEQPGFIAEELAKVDPRLVTFEKDEKTLRSVRYEQLTAWIVKSVQEMWQKVVGIDNRVQKLEKENVELRARIEALEKR